MAQVSEKVQINDMRLYGDFKGMSFSGFKISDVKKQFLLNMYQGKIEQSCYWCAEMVCAGHYMDIWELMLLYLGKHIHIANPKLPIYVCKRFQVFKNIIVQGLCYDEIQLRNNDTVRKLLAEIVCILCSSPKKNSLEVLKINKVEEFDMTMISTKLKAPSNDYGNHILRKDDPKELAICINEFAYHIHVSENHVPDMIQACYWVEWIIEFDILCKKNKNNSKIDRRHNIPVDFKFQNDVIWLIWDAILDRVESKPDVLQKQIIDSILNLFCIKYTTACSKKRRYLLYFAIAVITEPYNINIPIVNNKGLVENTLDEIDTIYKQIKKNERSPKTDYLFTGLNDNTSYQKSLQKIELLNSIDMR
jgi:hypothetical protein